jgi:predicted CXXCH cytochrome family protein
MVALNRAQVIALLGLSLAASPGSASASPAADQCRLCHEAMGDKPSLLFKRDVHAGAGITCAGCHGGNAQSDDPGLAMDPAVGFLGVPKGDAVSQACAACHSSAEKMKGFNSSLPTGQPEALKASIHGRRTTSGKESILRCTSCHGAHGIQKVRDPASPVSPLNIVRICTGCHSNAAFIRSYNPSMPVDQLEKYRTSVHGIRNAKGDARAASCAGCHGAHDILPAKDVKSRVYASSLPATCGSCHSNAEYMKGYGIPTDQFAKFAKSVHGVALMVKHDQSAPACNDCHGNHGAVPPGVESISKVCGSCHALNADLFSASPHKKAFDELKLPECETCHGNHGIVAPTAAMVGVQADALCSRCHTQTERPKGYAAAAEMRSLLDSLERSEARARGLVDEAEQKGMEISDAKFRLRDVHQARLETRTVVHAFNVEKFREAANKGLETARDVRSEAEQAIDDFYFRRIGLGIATLIITILAAVLYLFVRRLEAKQRSPAET